MPLFQSSRMQLLDASSTVEPSATSNRRLSRNFWLELSSPTWKRIHTLFTRASAAAGVCERAFPPAVVQSAAYQEERVAVGGDQLVGVEEDLVAEGRHVQMAGHLPHQLQQPGTAVAPRPATEPAVGGCGALRHRPHGRRLALGVAQERQGTLGVFHHNGSERTVKLGGGDFPGGRAGERAGGGAGRWAAVVRQAEHGRGVCGGLLAPGLLRRTLSGGGRLDGVDALGKPGVDHLPVEARGQRHGTKSRRDNRIYF